MRKLNGVEIENADSMSEIERLEAAFKLITNTAIGHLENDLEVAKAMSDTEAKKLCHIQMGMFRHAQSIFDTSKQWALNTAEPDAEARDALLAKLQRPNTRIIRK